jgi:hypothetical protein
MRIFRFSTVYIILGMGLGIYTAMRALDTTGMQSVYGNAGWQEWRLGENDRTLPYALGHFLGAGKVPPPKSARYFVRSLDDDGNSLVSDCVFKIEGPEIAARWWSLRAGDEKNSTLNAGQAIITATGRLNAVVSQHPLPGNWLTPPDTSRFTLTYVISEPAKTKDDAALVLPSVKKAGC